MVPDDSKKQRALRVRADIEYARMKKLASSPAPVPQCTCGDPCRLSLIEAACPLGHSALLPDVDFQPASGILMSPFKLSISWISLHSFPAVNARDCAPAPNGAGKAGRKSAAWWLRTGGLVRPRDVCRRRLMRAGRRGVLPAGVFAAVLLRALLELRREVVDEDRHFRGEVVALRE